MLIAGANLGVSKNELAVAHMFLGGSNLGEGEGFESRTDTVGKGISLGVLGVCLEVCFPNKHPVWGSRGYQFGSWRL